MQKIITNGASSMSKNQNDTSVVTTIVKRSAAVVKRRKNNLKLFVWTDFCPDYTGGLAVAIAKDIEEAQQLIVKHRGFEVYSWGNLHVYPLTKKMAECVSGGG
jgi:hypothetical protein